MVLKLTQGAWAKNLLASLTAYSGIGYLATAYAISRWLTRPSPAVVDPPRQTFSNHWLDVECQTIDRINLAGWVVTPPAPLGTVALFHGLRNNRRQILSRIDFFTRAGYRCVAFDHRGHGASQGRRTSFGYWESRDAVAVLEFIQRQWPDQPKVGLGMSMGAAALCFAGGQGAIFDALILEGLYPRLANAFHNRVGQCYPGWFRYFRQGVIWITEKRLGVKIEEVAPVNYISRLAPCPLLLLTGSDDPHAPPEEVETLHQQGGPGCEFQLIPSATHENLFECGGELYQDLVLNFLNRSLFRSTFRQARAA